MSKSKELYEKAKSVSVGGVHDFLRLTKPYPIFIDRAHGSKINDVEGNEYIDYLMGYGPVILGHCHPKVVKAVQKQAENGEVYGIGATENEYKVCEKLVKHIPSAEKVRLCNAGTDATYHAVRLARAYTKRTKLLKFEGSYNGWHDYLNISVMPPADKVGTLFPQSDGMLEEAIKKTIVIPYNDFEVFEKAIKDNREDLAAVFVEPIQHNIGCIMPKEGYLEAVRETTEEEDIPLVFDEVVTGFRHHIGGFQKVIGVTPDLTCVAKSMANGFTIGAVCGRDDIMNQLKPLGNVHAGATYYSNPISLAAAVATLEELETGNVHEYIFNLGDDIRNGLSRIIDEFQVKAQVVGYRSIFWIYFTDVPIENYRSLFSVDVELYAKFHAEMMKRGIIFSPHPIKRAHVSTAHSKKDVETLLNVTHETFSKLFR